MKNSGKVNLVLDFMMLLAMLAIFIVKGEFHEMLAYSLGGLLIIHIVLHWKQIKILYRQLIPEGKYQILCGVLAAAAIVAVLTMPLYVTVDSPGNNGDFSHNEYNNDRDFGPHGKSRGHW